ncbi:MAG: AsmA family protein [Deferribacteraceae bacterium]|jgi:AsmA protein|nr:AsmA family protein [Deferribacteraceae bacterium]
MIKLLKILAAIFVILIIIIILAIIIVPQVVDINSFKPQIYSIVKEKTGRDLVIGDIELKIFPWLKLTTTDITLSNAKNFTPEHMVKVSEVSVGVKVIPLAIHREIQLSSVILDGVEIYYLVDKDGVTNIDDILATVAPKDNATVTPEPTPTPAEPTEKKPLPVNIDNVSVSEIRLTNARITYADDRSGMNIAISPANITTGKFSLQEPVDIAIDTAVTSQKPAFKTDLNLAMTVATDFADLTLTAVDINNLKGRLNFAINEIATATDIAANLSYNIKDSFANVKNLQITSDISGEAIPQGRQSVSLDTALTFDLKNELLKLSKLDLNAAGVSALLTAEGKTLLSSPDVAAKFAVKEFSPKNVLNMLNIKLPEMTNANALTKVALNADITFKDNVATVPLTLALDGSTIKGSVKADLNGAKPAIAADFNLDSINADGYMPKAAPAGQGSPTTPAAPAAPANKDIDIKMPEVKVDLTSAPDVNAKITAKSIVIKGMNIRDMIIAVTLKDGVLNVTPMTMLLDGAKVSGTISGVFKGQKPDIKVSLSADAINLDKIVPPPAKTATTSTGRADPAPTPATTAAKAPAEIYIPNINVDLTPLPNVTVAVSVKKFDAQGITLQNIVLNALLKDGVLTVNPFKLVAFGGNISTNVAVTGKPKQFAASFGVSASALNLTSVLNKFAPAVDTATLPKRGSLDIKGSYTNKTFKMPTLSVKADALTLTGDIAANLAGKPSITFNMAVNDVDVNKFMPKKPANSTAQTSSAPTQEAASGGGVPAFDLATLPINAEGNITVKSVTFDTIKASAIKTHVKAVNGTVGLTDTSTNIFGGSILIPVLTATGSSKDLTTKSDLQLRGIKAEELLKLAGMKKPVITGKITALSNLTTHGLTVDEILGSLDGKASYTISEGALQGIAYNPNMFNIDTIKNMKLFDSTKSTKVQEMKGEVTIANGLATFAPIKATSSNLTATVQGGVGLKDMALNMDGSLEVAKISVPMKITGKLTAPKLDVDEKTLVKDIAAQYAKDAAKNAIKNSGVQEKIQDSIKDVVPDKVQDSIKDGLNNLFNRGK